MLVSFSMYSMENELELRVKSLEKGQKELSEENYALAQALLKSRDQRSNNNNNSTENPFKFTPIEPDPSKKSKSPVQDILKLYDQKPSEESNNLLKNIFKKMFAQKPMGLNGKLKTTLSYLEDKSKFKDMPQLVLNRFLLYGEPGVGKTELVKEIHQRFQLPMVRIISTEFEEGLHGDSRKKIQALCNTRDQWGRPLILLIDEFDAAARKRTERSSEAHFSIVDTLLGALEAQDGDLSVFTFVATNHKDSLDKAILSRFKGLCVEILPMSESDRNTYIDYIAEENKILASNALIGKIAKVTKGHDRRTIALALRGAAGDAWLSKRLMTFADFKSSLEDANNEDKVPWKTKIHTLALDSQPYLNILSCLSGWVGLASSLAQFSITAATNNKNIEEQKQHQATALVQQAKDRFAQRRWNDFNQIGAVLDFLKLLPSDKPVAQGQVSYLMFSDENLSCKDALKIVIEKYYPKYKDKLKDL